MRHAIFRYITLCLTLLAFASCNETVDETLRTDYPAPQPYTAAGATWCGWCSTPPTARP